MLARWTVLQASHFRLRQEGDERLPPEDQLPSSYLRAEFVSSKHHQFVLRS